MRAVASRSFYDEEGDQLARQLCVEKADVPRTAQEPGRQCLLGRRNAFAWEEAREGGSMKRFVALFLLASVLTVAALAQSQEGPPSWAYPVNPPDFKLTPDDGSLRHVPDSTAGFTLTQLRDLFFGPDWHPDDHPAMPDVVTHGRKPDVFACAYCHRADGPGGPENARLAGLAPAYFLQQMADFKSGARVSSAPKRNIGNMVKLSKAISDEEIASAVAYFSSLKPKKTIDVIETDTVPKTYVYDWHLAVLNGSDKVWSNLSPVTPEPNS
jgi:cytochrome c553